MPAEIQGIFYLSLEGPVWPSDASGKIRTLPLCLDFTTEYHFVIFSASSNMGV